MPLLRGNRQYETTWQYSIIWDLHKIGLRGRLPVFVSQYLRDQRMRVRIGTLALRAFCTSPVSSLYTEAKEAPLEERRLRLSMHYYVKTRACIDNRAHHALHEFHRTTRYFYAARPSGIGGMTRPPAPPIGLKVEEAMTSAEMNAELVCPPKGIQLPTRNARLWSQETRPHWKSK